MLQLLECCSDVFTMKFENIQQNFQLNVCLTLCLTLRMVLFAEKKQANCKKQSRSILVKYKIFMKSEKSENAFKNY